MKLTSKQEAIARDATTTLLNYCLSSTPREVIHKIISDAITRALEPVQEERDHLSGVLANIKANDALPNICPGKMELELENHDLKVKLQAQSEDTETGWVLRDEICERVPWDTPSKQAWVRIRYAARKE